MILVIDNYDSFTYNLVQLLAVLGADVRVERNDAVTPGQVMAMAPRGIVISPGPGEPSQAGMSEAIIREAGDAGIPILGVCLGHQAIAEVYGGHIVRSPHPVHGKTADVSHSGAGVLDGMPENFVATRYHSLMVDPDTLPPCLEVTATSADGIIMAMRHTSLPIFGVQFHPESVLTPDGMKILSNFLTLTGEITPVAPENGGSDAVEGGATPQGASAGREAAAKPLAPREDSGRRGSAALAPEGKLTVLGAIAAVTGGASLREEQAYGVMDEIMSGDATSAQIAALATALRMKGETVDEITGFAKAMRAHATVVHPKVEHYIDTCGTGGDGMSTFNVSTTTAFVVAGAGVPIAKHGNRAVSSKAGSADVLEALGVRIDLSPEDMARCIDEVGVGFLFAQSLHASMRHAGGARREIAIRTVFNILGPLTNPAGAKRQLLGVYDAALAPIMAEVAGRLGAERVMVVHGHPGMDEVSASGPTTVAEFRDGAVTTYEVTPEQAGLPRGTVYALAGGDATRNAEILRGILSGENGPRRDVILINAGMALLAAGAVEDLAEGVAKARNAIDYGEALARLDGLVALTQRLGAEADERAVKEAAADSVVADATSGGAGA
jgi:anthranilate synthase/phosphoribosyltransferase